MMFKIENHILVGYIEEVGITDVTIPNGVTAIGKRTFANCSNLESIIIPDSVTSIGDGAFANCSSLTDITIPDSVTSIDEWAFFNCSRLETASLPAHLCGSLDRVFPNYTQIIYRQDN